MSLNGLWGQYYLHDHRAYIKQMRVMGMDNSKWDVFMYQIKVFFQTKMVDGQKFIYRGKSYRLVYEKLDPLSYTWTVPLIRYFQ